MFFVHCVVRVRLCCAAVVEVFIVVALPAHGGGRNAGRPMEDQKGSCKASMRVYTRPMLFNTASRLFFGTHSIGQGNCPEIGPGIKALSFNPLTFF